MKLYHGTDYDSAMNISIYGVDLNKSNKYLDFGAGFYTTPDITKAEKRAMMKAKGNQEKAYIVILDVDETYWSELKIKVFEKPDIAWGRFILYNRCGINYVEQHESCEHNLDYKYDIVIGDIADGRVSNIAYAVKNGYMDGDDVDFNDFMRNDKESYGNQVSFHTKKSLECIQSIECDKIKIDRRKKRKGGEQYECKGYKRV